MDYWGEWRSGGSIIWKIIKVKKRNHNTLINDTKLRIEHKQVTHKYVLLFKKNKKVIAYSQNKPNPCILLGEKTLSNILFCRNLLR